MTKTFENAPFASEEIPNHRKPSIEVADQEIQTVIEVSDKKA
jgi:hypothetical protein